MKLGFALPQIGALAGAEAIARVAKKAEQSGYDSVWVLDRLLWPLKPQAPYPGAADGTLPELYKTVLDPLETLAFVAGHTNRLELGTSVLNIPFYNPVMLARQLSTIDQFSAGKLRVGFGLGWSPDEFEALGATMKDRGTKAEEFIEVLKTIWTAEPVEFSENSIACPDRRSVPSPSKSRDRPFFWPPSRRRRSIGSRAAATDGCPSSSRSIKSPKCLKE